MIVKGLRSWVLKVPDGVQSVIEEAQSPVVVHIIVALPEPRGYRPETTARGWMTSCKLLWLLFVMTIDWPNNLLCSVYIITCEECAVNNVECHVIGSVDINVTWLHGDCDTHTSTVTHCVDGSFIGVEWSRWHMAASCRHTAILMHKQQTCSNQTMCSGWHIDRTPTDYDHVDDAEYPTLNLPVRLT